MVESYNVTLVLDQKSLLGQKGSHSNLVKRSSWCKQGNSVIIIIDRS